MKKGFKIGLLIIGCVLALSSCSLTKYVPAGEQLLRKNEVICHSKAINATELSKYIKQKPNSRILGVLPLSLMIYNMSGQDTAKAFNRWLRRIGSAPVIYNQTLTERSTREIEKALVNKGYLHAVVMADTIPSNKGRELKAVYYAVPNTRFFLSGVQYDFGDSTLNVILGRDSASLLKPGMPFDRNMLENERIRITNQLQRRGYYNFTKDFITLYADTSQSTRGINVELVIRPMAAPDSTNHRHQQAHQPVYINNVYFVTTYNPASMQEDNNSYTATDTLQLGKYFVLYNKKHDYLRASTLIENCFIKPGSRYNPTAIENTYSAFSRLRILKYINIRFESVMIRGKEHINCYLLLTEGDSQTISFNVEGTNSAGDFGFALGTGYTHRNIFKGSETLSIKARASYESLSGNFAEILYNNFFEGGGDIGITYPKFLFPFLDHDFRRKIRATTEFALNANYQRRPEYTRLIAGGTWRYRWSTRRNTNRHQLDFIDISYIFLPSATEEFIKSVTEDNPLLRYSYEDQFIMRTAYTFYHSNMEPGIKRDNPYSIRISGEIAGNVLQAISAIAKFPKNDVGAYTLANIRFAQYAKIDIDLARTFTLDARNSLTLHTAIGVGIPYGNSEILPFDKRYFAGGANSVRGWSVRSLGPGTFAGTGGISNFLIQCGDIKLDFNIEYRVRAIWKIEFAAFIDAGNIWTIRDYPAQPGGVFRFNSFYKEIAIGYGAGIRFDFDFFVLRFDLGFKAYDPAHVDGSKWVFPHFKFARDTNFHFAVGYPF